MLKQSLVLFVSLVLLGCSSSNDEPPLPAVPVVRLLQLDPEAIVAERYFPARIEASRAANLSFQVPGKLVHIPVIKGDKIEEGSLIARLEQTDYQLLLESARVSFEKAERDLRRLQQLHQQNHVSQAQLDEARTAYDRAKVEKDRAGQNLIYTEIFAPYDAIIADRMMENFTQVSAGTPVVRIQDLSRLEVEIAVPEILLPEVEDPNGYTVTATLPSLPERPFDLSFKEYSTEPNPRSRTYRVTFEMDNPGDLRLLPGMSATVKVALKPNDVQRPILPLHALLGQGEQTQVFVYSPETETVSLRQVELGRLLADGIEIVSGIDKGEWVVAAGAGFLSEGMRVRSDRELKESR